ncbi:Flagellum-specific ATP synthase [Buchnera aphidicola (Eriosoma grossulariae)]
MNLQIERWLKKINLMESKLNKIPNLICSGSLVGLNGIVFEVSGLILPIGAICIIETHLSSKYQCYKKCEVIGFKDNIIFIIPLDGIVDGVSYGDRVFSNINLSCLDSNFEFNNVPLGNDLLGRVLDSQGVPLDKLESIKPEFYGPLFTPLINPLDRQPIKKILDLGIRSINSLLTIGVGQRIGLFSSSGLGKSVLLGMIAKYSSADVIVLGLIGERGREVKEFIDNILGKEGLSRSVIVAVPADVSALSRIKGTIYATRIAEYFREQKKHVLLIIDSLTRYAMSLREVSLSLGELPVTKGYPSSVFSKLPMLIERAGNSNNHSGSISAIYTILTEQDTENDPISDIAKSVLDGHIVLSKNLAESGRYPAIDVSVSISRLMTNLISDSQYNQVIFLKQLISIYNKNEDLINIGAYVAGSNKLLDKAILFKPKLDAFLQQDMHQRINYGDSCLELEKLFNEVHLSN